MNTESISITPNRKCGGITNQSSISCEYDNPTTSLNHMMIKQKKLQYEDNNNNYNYNHSNSDDCPQIHQHNDSDDDENDTDIYRIVRTKMISPPPPPPLPQQPQLEQHDGNNTPHTKPYHHSHPNTFSSSPNKMIWKKESLLYSPQQQYGCSTTSPLIPKSIMTAWTPTTTATTTTTTMTPLLPTTTTKYNRPLPLLTPQLMSHQYNNRNHHHHYHYEEEELELDDDHDHDYTESAIQFVERTTNEMHEIVQYWLLQSSSSSYDVDDESLQQQQQQQQQALYHDDDPIRIDFNSTTTKQQRPIRINENNTLWHLLQEEEEEEDRVDIYHGKNDDLVVDENVLDVQWPITNEQADESLSVFLFDTLSTRKNTHYHHHIPNEDTMPYADSDFDTCVEDFFTHIEECQWNMQRPSQHKYRCYTATRTTGTNQFCSSNDDDDDYYYYNIDRHHDTNEELNDWANILYSSTSPSVNCSVSIKEQSSSLQPPTPSLLTKWMYYPQQQPRKYHPLIMVHSRKKTKFNIPTKSFWQWIDQQMNHDDDLQQQQFHRRIWNLAVLSITLLMLLSSLMVVVLLVQQSILYIDSYRVNDIPIMVLEWIPTMSTSTCAA